MPKRPEILIVLLVAVLSAGCSGLRFPGVYRIDIEQGNIVDDAMLAKLRPGMTEDQVRFVMGSPQLVDPFEAGRWVYLYRLRRGNGDVVENRVVLWLTDGKLARWEGKGLAMNARSRLDTSGTPANSPAVAGAAPDSGETAPDPTPDADPDSTPDNNPAQGPGPGY